jgi:apolipoprotein N-acyltransferase
VESSAAPPRVPKRKTTSDGENSNNSGRGDFNLLCRSANRSSGEPNPLTLTDRRSLRQSGFVRTFADSVILAWGWRRSAIAVVAGTIGALALSPVNFWPAMFASMTLAVWLIDGAAGSAPGDKTMWRATRAAAAVGWFWGFGYFVAGLWWLGSAFLVEADKFAWALPFGVLALPAGLAVFPALGFALARLLWSSGAVRVLALAVGLCASEWLRCNILTGFPWNELGMALGRDLVLAQVASILGLHGLTLLGVAIFAAPATLIDAQTRPLPRQPAVLAIAALALIGLYGAWRLSGPPAADVAGVRLRLVQPNLPQDASFSASNSEAVMQRYLALSDRATAPASSGIADVTHLIWPESAFPFLLARNAKALAEIADLLHGGATLITGAARLDDGTGIDRQPHFYNSIQIVDSRGTLLERYDKRHLVPFGEYLPLSRLFARLGIAQFVDIPGGFESGAADQTLRIAGLPEVTPLICYEAIFPIEFGGTAWTGGKRPAWLLNVTNDAWFGLTPGPHQHFTQARLRAIEEGVPLVRAANSGISAVTDGLGRIVAEIPLGADGVIDSGLPAAQGATVFSKYGAAIAFFLWFVALALSLAARQKGRQSRLS